MKSFTDQKLDYSVVFIIYFIAGIFLVTSVLAFLFPVAWGNFSFLAPNAWAGIPKPLAICGLLTAILGYVLRILVDIRYYLREIHSKQKLDR